MQVSRAAGFMTDAQQMTQLYLHVSPGMRELIFKPRSDMTKDDFIEHLRDKQQVMQAVFTNGWIGGGTPTHWSTNILRSNRLQHVEQATASFAEDKQAPDETVSFADRNRRRSFQPNMERTVAGGTGQFRPYRPQNNGITMDPAHLW